MFEKVLVVAAHPDDEVLGCGGTIAKLTAAGHEVDIVILGHGRPTNIGNVDACLQAANILGANKPVVYDLPDNRFDTQPLLDVVQLVEEDAARSWPALVFTHSKDDLNIDHRITYQAVVTAIRPYPLCVFELYSFEVPSSTEWQFGSPFVPDTFCDISATLDRKLRALKCYSREMRPYPHPRSYQAVEHLARWRGATVGLHAAEAFQLVRRIVL